MPILAIIYTVKGGGYSHSIHKVMKVGPQSTKEVGTHDAMQWFCKQTRWDHEGWPCGFVHLYKLVFDLAWV
jgi:hypothetical protein